MSSPVPILQSALLLNAPKQKYKITREHPVPKPGEGEVLIQTQVVGLNPLDWKAPDFNFALPVLPYIAGRELVGQVVQTSDEASEYFSVGDRVVVISTDYRDLRKASFQQYVIASDFNTLRLPENVDPRQGACVGVGFVAAALALGVSLGLDFSNVHDGPDLLRLVRSLDAQRFAPDILHECLYGVEVSERAVAGDWIVIWGGSSVTANLAAQLARLAGLRVVLVFNQAKHGLRIATDAVLQPDLLVDSHDPARAIEVIQGTLGRRVRFALDTHGHDSTTALIAALDPARNATSEIKVHPFVRDTAPKDKELLSWNPATPPRTPPSRPVTVQSHVIGLAGVPKTGLPSGVSLHSVPIKLFHEVPEVGRPLTTWLHKLLSNESIKCPDILSVDHGLEGVNVGLDRMRSGVVSGGRAVVEFAA
ncbi:chaperonin 10-like protein [Microdochium trichocladiopsis]|uniref:Chaperonin 10-like protein n=1 Tax=Microdochium trichocladiopsis TaxID=1682393 RepID=A0A9P8YAY4_9PEZI|nr:chaperonin 10-like protein [Microdochium trichocladiopsis]KAH7034535.1 chaperonin 10-like protein [Microdochium trichocladiopsis]